MFPWFLCTRQATNINCNVCRKRNQSVFKIYIISSRITKDRYENDVRCSNKLPGYHNHNYCNNSKYQPKVRRCTSGQEGFCFFLKKKGNNVSNIYCKIQDHIKKIFLKIVIFNIAGLHQSPSPSDFDGLPYPRVRWFPKLFHQNESKGGKRDYLDALSHLLWRFRATGENP